MEKIESDPEFAHAHAFRPTIFSRERSFRLTERTLEMSDGETAHSVPLADVVAVRLYRQSGGGMGPAIRRAVLTLRDGGRLVIQSTHYIRFGVVEDRADSYRAFVTALVERVVAANPKARVTLGHSWLAWSIWLAIFAAAIAVLALGAVVLARGDFPLGAWLYLAVVAAFVPTMWRVVGRSRPRPGDPRALPAAVLE